MPRKYAILTSGGDAAGMNYAVVSAARCAAAKNIDLVGIQQGYLGIIGSMENLMKHIVTIDVNMALDMEAMRGTWLRTARCTEFLDAAVRKQAYDNLKDAGIDALIVIGGNGTFKGAECLTKLGLPCVGIPGTVDNDLGYTEYTLGFNTAVGECVDVVRSVRATSRSHDRPHVVEVMGRDCGEIALSTAEATGAEILIVSEEPWTIDWVADRLKKLADDGNTRATVVIAEHSWEKNNMDNGSEEWVDYMNKFYTDNNISKKVFHGEEFSTHRLAQILKMKTGLDVRHTVVGYTQRGAQCSAYDGKLAFECGYHAIELLANAEKDTITSRAICITGGKVSDMDFMEAQKLQKKLNKDMVHFINSL